MKKTFRILDTHKFRDPDYARRELSPDVRLYARTNVREKYSNFRSIEVPGEFRKETLASVTPIVKENMVGNFSSPSKTPPATSKTTTYTVLPPRQIGRQAG